jgi:hypothetical protein
MAMAEVVDGYSPADHAMRVIAHRAPEAVEFVVSYEIFEHVLEVIAALSDRADRLEAALGVDQKAV